MRPRSRRVLFALRHTVRRTETQDPDAAAQRVTRMGSASGRGGHRPMCDLEERRMENRRRLGGRPRDNRPREERSRDQRRSGHNHQQGEAIRDRVRHRLLRRVEPREARRSRRVVPAHRGRLAGRLVTLHHARRHPQAKSKRSGGRSAVTILLAVVLIVAPFVLAFTYARSEGATSIDRARGRASNAICWSLCCREVDAGTG
jgi:hypothetical protein